MSSLKESFSLKNIGLAIVFLFFMLGGITHFTDPDFYVSIMPPYVGYHLTIVYISGVLEILGAIGILIPSLRQMAGNGLVLLVVCVSPANIHMWMHPELFPDVPETFLTVRLILQVALIILIWRCTRAPVLAKQAG
ncbi:MAG: DoxX family protein [Halioglobus sp.]|nr:DoxX family protein [Halioglobus sp.]